MPESHTIALTVWHLALGGLTLLGAWLAYDRHYLAPLRKWRADMDKWAVGVDKDLSRGTDKFDTLEKAIASLATKVDAHENAQRDRDQHIGERLTAIETLLRERRGMPPD